jgi:hypothetical protein
LADEINIDMEVTLLRRALQTAINESKLPITVKAMIVNELQQAANSMAELQLINLLKSLKQKTKIHEAKEVEK